MFPALLCVDLLVYYSVSFFIWFMYLVTSLSVCTFSFLNLVQLSNAKVHVLVLIFHECNVATCSNPAM